MLHLHVSDALRLAIHFGKWVASTVPLTAVLIDRSGAGPIEERLAHDLIRKYIFFWKLRRRAFRIIAKNYPKEFGGSANTRPSKKNVALVSLVMRMEATAGKLDEAIKRHIKEFVVDDLQQYASRLWRGGPNPPPFIELEIARWALHEIYEDVKIDVNLAKRRQEGDPLAMREYVRRIFRQRKRKNN